MRRYDFSDYLDLRRARDLGRLPADGATLLAQLEKGLPVPFAGAIPGLPDLAPGPEAPPRGLDAEHVRVMFAMREELVGLGRTRAAMHGLDLPDGDAAGDLLNVFEEERKIVLEVRRLVRDLDVRIWAAFTGDRRMPSVEA